jgi:hypothetical protein
MATNLYKKNHKSKSLLINKKIRDFVSEITSLCFYFTEEINPQITRKVSLFPTAAIPAESYFEMPCMDAMHCVSTSANDNCACRHCET